MKTEATTSQLPIFSRMSPKKNVCRVLGYKNEAFPRKDSSKIDAVLTLAGALASRHCAIFHPAPVLQNVSNFYFTSSRLKLSQCRPNQSHSPLEAAERYT